MPETASSVNRISFITVFPMTANSNRKAYPLFLLYGIFQGDECTFFLTLNNSKTDNLANALIFVKGIGTQEARSLALLLSTVRSQ